MKFLKNTLLLLFLIIIMDINAQEIEHKPPTLQVGLDGINFSKGSLDPEIIARIIAAKQSEIKIKIIQNSFLKKLYGSGGTIYNYADNIIKGIIQEPDVDVRTRKIIESTVNLVFVYAFADFYLKQVNENPEQFKNLHELAKSYNLDSLKNFSPGLKYRTLLEMNPGLDSKKLNPIKKLNSKSKITDKENYLNKFMALIIDIASEVIRNDEKLRDLGLMRISYSTNYDYLNLYKQQQNYNAPKDTTKNKAGIERELNKKGNSKNVYDEMECFLEKYTKHIGTIKYIIENRSFKSNSASNVIATQVIDSNNLFKFFESKKAKGVALDKDNIKVANFTSFKDSIVNTLKQLSEKYNTASIKNKELVNENYLEDLETAIKKLTASLNYIKRIKEHLKGVTKDNVTRKVLIISDMLYTLKNEVIPNIEYSIKFAPDLIATKDAVTDLAKDIYLILLPEIKYLDNINKDPAPFLKLVSKLYEFDKSKTFSEYISLITLLDEIFETGNFKTALSTINTFVKDYTKIATDEKGNEVLVFNVESFLVKLNTIQSDKIRRVQFHFTVGMNTALFLNGNFDIGNNEKISSFSHFSEKIGVKFKIINRGDWLPKNPGESYGSLGYNYVKTSAPKEPLISNFHALVYGSGILYNLIDSSTNKEFNYPMVGAGLGLTFYNALDFNVSVGVPLLDTGGVTAMGKNAFLSFGFDIQFLEYLKEVGKKRKERKQNKLLMSKK